MCGIAGAWVAPGWSADPELGTRMIQALRHRGPDDVGCEISHNAFLAHARLSILDLSPAGHQPMPNEDGNVWIVFNGEIYNFTELRLELEGLRHRFRSHTDTEVVIHAYEQWGIDCLQRLTGMFAFALWDENQRRLWLVRDRLGIKPLFYAANERGVFFGSEIKAVLASGAVSRDVDFQALSYFLALNYTPAPRTLFREVRQLPAGHYLLIGPDGAVRKQQYWDLEFECEPCHRSESQWVASFEELMHLVVGQHLVSDVPFGLFLSGGMDSSSLAWWMREHLSEPLRSFTIRFAEKSHDESPYARMVADTLGTNHSEFIVTPDLTGALPELVWHAEEPTADSSMLAMYYLAREARQRVKMVLAGDGSDEILAGYDTYTAYYILRLYYLLPDHLRAALESVILRFLPVRDAKLGWEEKLRRFLNGARHSPELAHGCWRMIFNSQARQELLAPLKGQAGVEAEVLDLYRDWFARCKAGTALNRMLYVDTRFYLPNDMLVKVDRMTMAHGLEARVPFLDHRVVEFCAQVPEHLKLKRYTQKKYLLKKTMRGRLPKQIIKRRKAGFNLPNARWLRGELRELAGDLLSGSSLRQIGWFDAKFVEGLFQDHLAQRADNSHQLWGLLVLVLWWRQNHTGGYIS